MFQNVINRAGLVGFCVTLACLGGCMSHTSGTAIEKDQLSRITKGTTTRSEVEAMFGTPASLIIMPDGSGRRMATWQYTQTNAHANGTSYIPLVGAYIGRSEATSERRSLQVTYTNKDVVEDFVYSGGTTTVDQGMFGGSMQTKADTPISPQ